MADSYAYCTIADLETRYGAAALLAASDRDGVGVLDTALVTAACQDATELMDGYLGERYTLPLTPLTGVAVGWARTIAWFLIQFSPRDEDRRAYADALDQLDRARLGKFVLQSNGVADAGVPVEGDVIAVAGERRVFTDASLRSF